MLLLVFASLHSSAHARLESNAFLAQEAERQSVNCSQAAIEQKAVIREAEKERYTLRRVELIGNVSTPERLRQRIVSRMREGELFRRHSLMSSLRNVSRLKTLYPVTMKDVVARLDKAEKTLDLRICFKERVQPIRRAS